MITLNLKLNDEYKKVDIKEDVIFNSLLTAHPDMVKALIKSVSRTYRIDNKLFDIVNKFVDFDENGLSLYPGLIVRTGESDYAVLYLEGSTIDEVYMIDLIKQYIYDTGDFTPEEVNVDKFEIDKDDFLMASSEI